MGRAIVICLILFPQVAHAHVSEQGFVLLLPTNWYAAGGAATVVLTILLMALLPSDSVLRAFATVRLMRAPPIHAALQLVSLCAVVALLIAGLTGPTDPLRNPWPLTFWVVFWIGLVAVQGAVFDVWRWINPFAALARLVPAARATGRPSYVWAIVLFLAFAGFLLADPAPNDPTRLATFGGGYMLATALALVWFGPSWLVRGEVFTVLMRTMRLVAPWHNRRLGAWGWHLARGATPSATLAVFMMLILGSGSFDGLNETFWWLQQIGVNPLEFPGRSAVIVPTLAGLFITNLALIAAYAIAIALGQRIAGGTSFKPAFCQFAPSLLPIAVGYHVAHYLTSFLVDIQYARNLFLGWFGVETDPVTTGFFNTLETVRVIWLTQAGAVVVGHVVAVLVAHGIALRVYQSDRHRATLSQAPLAAFMVLYTLFGLWLLASPRGA